MRYDILVFALLAVFLLGGFAAQFLDLKGRGPLYALAALGALLGLPTLYRMRRTRLRRSIEERLAGLEQQQLSLDQLTQRYGDPAMARTREALTRVRTDSLRQLAEIEAEARMPLAAAREYARRLGMEELEGYVKRGD